MTTFLICVLAYLLFGFFAALSIIIYGSMTDRLGDSFSSQSPGVSLFAVLSACIVAAFIWPAVWVAAWMASREKRKDSDR